MRNEKASRQPNGRWYFYVPMDPTARGRKGDRYNVSQQRLQWTFPIPPSPSPPLNVCFIKASSWPPLLPLTMRRVLQRVHPVQCHLVYSPKRKENMEVSRDELFENLLVVHLKNIARKRFRSLQQNNKQYQIFGGWQVHIYHNPLFSITSRISLIRSQSPTEKDKMDLSNMRRDLTASQDRETENLREKLRQCKWEYDHIRVDNNNKEKQLLELAGGLVRYLGVTEASILTGTTQSRRPLTLYPSNQSLLYTPETHY